MRRSPTLLSDTSALPRVEVGRGSPIGVRPPLARRGEEAILAHPLCSTGPLQPIRLHIARDPELIAHERRVEAIGDLSNAILRWLSPLELAVAVFGLALIARAAWPAIIG